MNRLSALLLLAPLTVGCDTNFTQYFASEDQKNSMEQSLIEAQYEYDQGNYDEALSVALDVYNENPSSEEASLRLGYIYLSKAGLDAFNLASGLIDQGKSEDGEDKTASLFTSIADVIGVNLTEVTALSSNTTTSDTTGVTVYNPSTVTDARSSASAIVGNLNEAVSYLCPFVDDSAKLLDGDALYDERHDATNCPPTEYARELSGKANFAFALAHLGEAITFYSVLFYTDEGELKPNLERHVEGISSLTGDPTAYLTELTELETTIDAFFPSGTDADGSMINQVFNNLEVTNRSFSAIAGLPASVTKSITDAITDLRTKTDELSSASANTAAMKKSFTKGIAKSLATQINSSSATGQDLIDICEKFDSISEGAPSPDSCP